MLGCTPEPLRARSQAALQEFNLQHVGAPTAVVAVVYAMVAIPAREGETLTREVVQSSMTRYRIRSLTCCHIARTRRSEQSPPVQLHNQNNRKELEWGNFVIEH